MKTIYKLIMVCFISCSNNHNYHERLDYATNLAAEEKTEEAIKVYDEIIKYYEDSAIVYVRRGICKNTLGKNKSALNDIDIAIKLDKKKSEFIQYKGTMLQGLGRINEAIACYKKAIKIDSNFLALNNLALLRIDQEKNDEALKLLNKAANINQKSALVFYNRASLKHDLGNFAEAVEDYDIAIKLDSLNAQSYSDRAIIKFKMGNFIESLKDFNKAISIDEYNPDFYYYKSVVYENMDSTESRCQCLSKASTLGHMEAKEVYEKICLNPR